MSNVNFGHNRRQNSRIYDHRGEKKNANVSKSDLVSFINSFAFSCSALKGQKAEFIWPRVVGTSRISVDIFLRVEKMN